MGGFVELQQQLATFYEKRDWRRFQTPKDIAASIAIEAGELQELFLWLDRAEQGRVLEERRAELQRELADVAINCLNRAHISGVDLEAAVKEKLMLLEQKYPIADVHGKVIPHP